MGLRLAGEPDRKLTERERTLAEREGYAQAAASGKTSRTAGRTSVRE